MAKIIKIYCRHDDTPKQFKIVQLNIDARSYEEALRELIKMHDAMWEEYQRRKLVKFI